MDGHKPKQRYIWFWRLTLKSFLVLSLLMGFMSVSGRVSDQYICVQVANFNFQRAGENGLVDLNAGTYMTDARFSNAVFGINSPDNQYSVSYQPDRAGAQTNSLVIHATKTPDPQSNAASDRVVIEQGMFTPNAGNGFFSRFGQVSWSTDSQKLAYLWVGRDRQTRVSVVNANGTGKQTHIYPLLDNNLLPLLGTWSADNLYFSISERDTRTTNSVNSYTLWSAADLQPVDVNAAPYQMGAWSPQGHQFAALQTDKNGDVQMVIWSPDKVIKTLFTLPANQQADRLSWSPNSQYVALQGHYGTNVSSGAGINGYSSTSRWIFSIFGSDGTLLADGLKGREWDYSSASYRPTATWTGDGGTWVFLQQNTTDQDDLKAFHVAENRYETLATGIPAALSLDIFYTNPFGRFGPFASGATIPVGPRIVIPTEQDDRIKVELSDLDGKNRTTLVTNADTILAPSASFRRSISRFWTFDGRIAQVAWTAADSVGIERARLTWANADGSAQQQLDNGLQSISNLQAIGDQNSGYQWLGYLGTRDGVTGVEIAELSTGKHYHLTDVTVDEDTWSIGLSPDHQSAYLQVGTFNSSFSSTASSTNHLYVVSMSDQKVTLAGDSVTAFPIWSPDGSTLAYLHRTANSTSLQTVSLTSAKTQTVRLPDLNGNRLRLNGWTKCG